MGKKYNDTEASIRLVDIILILDCTIHKAN